MLYDRIVEVTFAMSLSLIGFALAARKTRSAAGQKKIAAFLEKYRTILLALILAGGAFLRFCRLGRIPTLDCDEASSMYDAWCIANFGVDRWLKPFPAYFSGIGGGQSPMCIYLLAAVAKVFGYNIVAYRAVFAAFGLLTVLLVYRMVRFAYSTEYALYAALLCSCMPVFVLFSRYCLDCNLMIPFFAAALDQVIRALRNGKTVHYLLAGIFTGLTLYTYILSYVVCFLLVALLFIACLAAKNLRVKNAAAFACPLGALSVVPALNFLVQQRYLPEMNILGVSFYRIAGSRGEDLSFSNILNVSAKLKSIAQMFFGPKEATYYANGMPIVYLFLIPLLVLGAVLCAVRAVRELRDRKIGLNTVLACACSGYFVLSLFLREFSAARFNGLLVVMLLLSVSGLEYMVRKFRAAAAVAVIGALLLTPSFGAFLFREYPETNRTAVLSDYGLHEVYARVRAQHPDAVIWVDNLSDLDSNIIPYVVTLGVDLPSPYTVYETTVHKRNFPYYDRARFFLPYDEVNDTFTLNDTDVYLVLLLDLGGPRDTLRSRLRGALQERGFGERDIENFAVFEKY